MRAGGCTLQQALTLDAAAVVKQAVGLARRRGHAQVTPLHVASTMLAAPTGLFRAACLQSHSHPLQCKALELCFNVALNRLPASSSSGPLLGPGGGYSHGHHHHHGHPPSLSNALVAAFKRAQAHQRRGSIESQQQPLLAVKIEVEQLIVSILDDPSVSRVMREAGFSSTQVKANVEEALQAENSNPGNSNSSTPGKTSPSSANQQLDHLGGGLQTPSITASTHPVRSQQRQPYKEEDVASVVECMVGSSAAGSRKFLAAKRSVVVVGECLVTAEAVVRGVMDQAEKDEAALLHGVQFISLPLSSFTRLGKEEVDRKVAELRCFIKSCCCFPGKGGVVLYLGDLRWAAEYRVNSSCVGRGGMSNSYYCPVEHVIFEIARMLAAFGSAAATAAAVDDGNQIDHCGGAGRFWVMGVATYQTYMRCKVGAPSLETLWGFHPLDVPSGSLDLSISCDSDLQIPLRSQGKDQSKDRDNGSIYSATCSLPSWLQKYKDTKNRDATNYKQQEISCHTRDFPTKYWSPTCASSQDQYSQETRTLNLSLVSSSLPSISVSYEYYQQKATYPTTVTKESQVWTPNPNRNSNNGDGSVSTSSSSETMAAAQAAAAPYCRRYKELSAENLKTLCAALEEKVPWQINIVPEIASTLLQCRSGLKRRKSRQQTSAKVGNAVLKEDTWLLFQGCDAEGKLRVARELAALVFGSHTRICSLRLGAVGKLSAESSGDDDADEDERSSKRSRTSGDQTPTVRCREGGCLQRFAKAVGEDPHRVFLLHDVEQWDCGAQAGIKIAIEDGKLRDNAGAQASLEDAVVVLLCEGFDARSRARSPPAVKLAEDECHSSSCVAALDLNALAGDEGDDSEGGDLVDDGGTWLLEAVDRAFFFGLSDC